MKRLRFIITACFLNVLLLFCVIYKNSFIVSLSFKQQQLEKTKHSIVKERERLQKKICALHNNTAVQQKAKIELGMRKITTNQVQQVAAL